MATREIAAVSVLSVFGGSGLLSLKPLHQVDAPGVLAAFVGVASLEVFKFNIVTADTQIPAFTARSDLSTLPWDGYPAYVERADEALRGATAAADGPDGCLVVAASEARQLCYLGYTAPRTLKILHRRRLPARPLAIAATAAHYFVLLEATARPDPVGLARLLVYSQTTNDADAVAELELPRHAEPRLLWADGDDAPFLVITGRGGGVEVRAADETLALLARVETGLYLPRVVDCRPRPDLARTGAEFSEQVWDIVVVSARSGRGSVLQVRQSTVRVVNGIAAACSLPSFSEGGGSASLTRFVRKYLNVVSVLPAFTAAAELEHGGTPAPLWYPYYPPAVTTAELDHPEQTMLFDVVYKYHSSTGGRVGAPLDNLWHLSPSFTVVARFSIESYGVELSGYDYAYAGVMLDFASKDDPLVQHRTFIYTTPEGDWYWRVATRYSAGANTALPGPVSAVRVTCAPNTPAGYHTMTMETYDGTWTLRHTVVLPELYYPGVPETAYPQYKVGLTTAGLYSFAYLDTEWYMSGWMSFELVAGSRIFY